MDTLTTSPQRAQALAEYGLMLAIVSVLSVVGLMVFGTAVSALISHAATTITPYV